MLRFLAIRRLAVIDALEVEFASGLNVLTGETGAGKSMLVEAVGLLVGGRASPELVRTGEETATIQAVFEHDGREIVVRREISAQGRSRAFIDDALCTTAALREQCGGLVDLHGQHEHQRLLDPATHLELVDEHAQLHAERAAVAAAFARWRALRDEMDELRRAERDRSSRLDLIAFQLAELEKVAPKPGEDDALAAARLVLANADKLSRLCAEAYEALYDGEHAALTSLAASWKRVGELAALDPKFQPYLEARDGIKSQLEDLAYFLRGYAGGIDASPERLQEVEDRLAALERLKRKYGPTLGETLDRMGALRRERDLMEHSADRAAALQQDLDAARQRFLEAAAALSRAREAHGERFCRALEKALAELAMPRTRCELRLARQESETAWTERGVDEGEFYLSPNPGEEVRPLARIVSGGELSRVMLALKTLAATDAPGKTLIFDEVDAGIGGAVADVVGAKLRDLGVRYQVLCITHLPQIAAYGPAHYRIDKRVKSGRTWTTVEAVTGPAREEELARMIGGTDIGSAVLASARALLTARREAAPARRRNR
ncbi:MAG TPA: DNA repair protein RecN [Vicinamibacterales bacterium]|nr:DNA repair protein RecN [Vicinamibacterales bacterium]